MTYFNAETLKHQPRILYPPKLFFYSEVNIKTFPDKQKLRGFVMTRSALQEIPKGAM